MFMVTPVDKKKHDESAMIILMKAFRNAQHAKIVNIYIQWSQDEICFQTNFTPKTLKSLKIKFAQVGTLCKNVEKKNLQ